MTLSISFEVFPPKSADALEGLRSTVARLSEVEPAFVSVNEKVCVGFDAGTVSVKVRSLVAPTAIDALENALVSTGTE